MAPTTSLSRIRFVKPKTLVLVLDGRTSHLHIESNIVITSSEAALAESIGSIWSVLAVTEVQYQHLLLFPY